MPRPALDRPGARLPLRTSGDDSLARDDRLDETHVNGYFPVTPCIVHCRRLRPIFRSRLGSLMATRRHSVVAPLACMRSRDIAIASLGFQACLSFAPLLPLPRTRTAVPVRFGGNFHQPPRFDNQPQRRPQSGWYRHAPGGSGVVLLCGYMRHRRAPAVRHSKNIYIPHQMRRGSCRRLNMPSGSAECRGRGLNRWYTEVGNDETIRNRTCSSVTRCWLLLFRTLSSCAQCCGAPNCRSSSRLFQSESSLALHPR